MYITGTSIEKRSIAPTEFSSVWTAARILIVICGKDKADAEPAKADAPAEKADVEPKADAPAEKADAEPKADAPAEKADTE